MTGVPQLGSRGGGWVVSQFALIALIVVAGVVGPGWPDSAQGARQAVGAMLALAGIVVAALSARALGPSLTPFPQPSAGAAFVAHGPYRLVRHPIYLGGILFLSGISVLLSPWALVLTAALGLLWAMKTHVEERFLRERFPEYAAYCERTRFRLVPFVY